MSPSATHAWIERTLASSPEPTPETVQLVELTATERRILQLSAEGRTRQDIAQALYVSANTVKFHFRNVYRKLGVDSREDALATARRLGLLPTER
nr:LuxR C-terminal-related transcriptional regulator [Plantibacter sp. MCCC 1A11337]